MGLNRLISLSKSSVLPDLKQVSSKSSKNSSKSAKLEQTEKCNKKELETQKIDKTLKNGKSATTAKKSMLWTLRITNKSKNGLKKGKFKKIKSYSKCLSKFLRQWTLKFDQAIYGNSIHSICHNAG